jgi:thiamine kinase
MSPNELEALAARWVPGQGAVRVQPMAKGLVNESFRVERDGRRYVMRMVTGASPDLGQDRAWECIVLACAADAGLAPVIERCEAADGVLVSAWVECRAWAPEETELPDNLQAMAELLQRVHALPLPQPARTMNPAAWIKHYEAALTRHEPEISRRSRDLHGLLDVRLARLAVAAEVPAVLCHSDLHRFNVAVGVGSARPGLLLLDWEYAHVSDPFWDLAGWAANNDWVGPQSVAWLGAYLRRPALPEETRRLSLWMWLYDYVCVLWSELYLNRVREGDTLGVGERLETLCARLASEAGSRAGELPAH